MSTSLGFLASEALAALISARVPALADKVAAVQEPPTAEKGYPAAAVQYDGVAAVTAHSDIEVEDADGVPIILDDGRAFMDVGSVGARARIWVAARTPAQRERLQTQIVRLFFGDEFAPTRCQLTIEHFEVDGFTTPTAWPVCFFLRSTEWTEELVFSERRWAFLSLEVDIPIFILREEAWRVTEMTLALTATTGNQPAAAAELAFIDEDGGATAAP